MMYELEDDLVSVGVDYYPTYVDVELYNETTEEVVLTTTLYYN